MDVISLPTPQEKGKVSVEECLAARRSVREYKNAPLSLAEVGQLLWAAQGITGPEKQRTAPSAGALYPLELYLVAGNVEGLPPGVYRYGPHRHQIFPLSDGDRRHELAEVALDQDCVRYAAAVLVLTAVFRRTTRRYKEKGIRYVHMEAGHVVENVALQAVALGLGTVPVGAFREDDVKRILKPTAAEEPLYMVAVGRLKRSR
jgi:SagB-type dehydrogenase family enzyme